MTQLISPFKIVHSIPSSMVPAHKIISTEPVMVMDAFSYGDIDGCEYYFLSHFHSDHYNGLTKNFKGNIICTTITRNLVVAILNVPIGNIVAIPLNVWTYISSHIQCLCLDAFHCPGSAIFFIRIRGEETVLHTGDFRAGKEVLENSFFLDNITNLSRVYLDSTYSSPKFSFPSQDFVLRDMRERILKLTLKDRKGCIHPIRRLYLIGSYIIGKEKIALTISELLGCKIYCQNRKKLVIRAMENEHFSSLLSGDPLEAQVHLVGMMDLSNEKVNSLMNQYWPKYTHATIIKGTGWTHTLSSNSITYSDHILVNRGQNIRRKGTIMRWTFPYSEHSSYSELVDFINCIIRHSKITPFPSLIMTVDNSKDIGLRLQSQHNGSLLFTIGKEFLDAWIAYKA